MARVDACLEKLDAKPSEELLMMNDDKMRVRIRTILTDLQDKRERLKSQIGTAGKPASLAVALGASSKALNGCMPVSMYGVPDDDASFTDAAVQDGQVNDLAAEDDAGMVVRYGAPQDAATSDLAAEDDAGMVVRYGAPLDAGE